MARILIGNFKGPQGIQGEPGVSIESVEQTKTSYTSGGKNEITVTLSDGSTSMLEIYNGAEGDLHNIFTQEEEPLFTGETKILEGDIWINSSNFNFYTYNGLSWDLRGNLEADKIDGVTDAVTTDENGLTVHTITIDFTKSESQSFQVSDGVGIASIELDNQDGGGNPLPYSSVSGETNTYKIKLTNGTSATFSITNGTAGKPFKISKTYNSIALMEADFENDDVDEGEFCVINVVDGEGNTIVDDEDNAKLFCKGNTGWVYITDLSGAQGIQGEQGIQGIQGLTGLQGASITSVVANTISTENGGTSTYDVMSGETVLGQFSVKNGGDPNSMTDAEIDALVV